MNKKEWSKKMSLADESYVYESDFKKNASRRVNIGRLSLIAACLALFTVFNVWLFKPYDTSPPDVSAYEGSEYYPIIAHINKITFNPPRYKNNFDAILSTIISFGALGDGAVGGAGAPESGGSSYVEVTDNQFASVTEPDRIKRSDTHLYYMNGATLTVYSIEGEASEKKGEYTIGVYASYSKNSIEFYLSEDCDTVTVIIPEYTRGTSSVRVVNLDVTDPTSIYELSSVSTSGSYVTSRYKDGNVLLITSHEIYKSSLDYDKPETFLPEYNDGNSKKYISINDITIPEISNYIRYTALYMLNGETLELADSAACFSYSSEVTVSENNVYLTHAYSERSTDGVYNVTETMTEITVLGYSSGALTDNRTVTVSGYVNDRFSIDEFDGIMRIVTTTSKSRYREITDGNTSSAVLPDVQYDDTGMSASLYCFALDDLSLLGSVERFAPRGESVRSARFDGTKAYVCTSMELTDPVFFFDLSDLQNITYKDTGTIPGFSTSLITFGEGKLLGIGRGDSWDDVKVELYAATDTTVVSLADYVLEDSSYSGEYKSYLIDRENELFGFGYLDYKTGKSYYILLAYNGYGFVEAARIDALGDLGLMRATLIDGYLYFLSGDTLSVAEIYNLQ